MDFERKVKRLLGSSRHGRIRIRDFEKEFPRLADQIRRDRESPFLDIWGQSYNTDELENSAIVDRKFLTTIGRIANTNIRDGQSYHAGLIHTYGYLFSLLPTKHGYKRERWTQGIIEKGLGIPERCLSPQPPDGTLFANVSFLLSSIAIGRKSTINDANVSERLKLFRFRDMKRHRILETCRYSVKKKRVQLVTDIVDFGKTVKKCCSLLVYSTLIAKQRRLITCFPIQSKSRDELFDIAAKNSTPIKARFNLAIMDFPSDGVYGERTIENLKL